MIKIFFFYFDPNTTLLTRSDNQGQIADKLKKKKISFFFLTLSDAGYSFLHPNIIVYNLFWYSLHFVTRLYYYTII